MRQLIRIIFFLSMNCLPLFFYGVQLGGCGAATSALGGNATDTADDLTTTDTQLYEGGPVDMPVTVAKLESPDLSKITITVEAITTESIAASYLTSGTYRFTIVGSAGAFSTDKMFVYNTVSDSQVISEVASDGSATASIDGSFFDSIVITGMNSDESQVSPPLVASFDDNGVPTIALTNTTDLNTDQNVMIDSFGYYYVSLDNGDGTYSLVRRSSSGFQLETLVTTLTSQPRVVMATAGAVVTVILQDGSILTLTAALPADIIAPDLVSADESSDWTSTAIETISGGLIATPGTGYHLILNDTSNGLVITYPFLNPATQTQSDYLMKIMDSNGMGIIPLLPTTEYAKLVAALGPDDMLYVFYDEIEQASPTLAKMELIAPGTSGNLIEVSNAWDARTTITTETHTITHLDVAADGNLVYQYIEAGDEIPTTVFWDANTNTPTIVTDTANNQSVYYNPIPTSDSEIVIFCDMGPIGENGTPNTLGALVYWVPGEAPGTVHDLIRYSDKFVCSDEEGSFFVTPQNQLFFFSGTDQSDAQLSSVYLPAIPELETLF